MDIPIKCPGCGHNFKLRAQNPASLSAKVFKCPKCGRSTPFSQMLGRAGIPTPPPIPGGGAGGAMHTHSGGMPAAGGGLKTQLGGAGGAGGGLHTHIGGAAVAGGGLHTQVHNNGPRPMLFIPALNRQFPLGVGQFVLGRESSDSQATIKLAPDPYMSRSHACLTVAQSVSGASVVTLTGMNPKNDIFINNKRIHPMEGVKLSPGDEILLGNTVVKYILR